MSSTSSTPGSGRDAIDLLLRQLHVFSMQPEQRRQIGGNLAAQGITVGMLRAVWSEARQSSRDDESARGLFASTLRDPGTVLQVAADVEDRLERLHGLRGVESDMRFVTQTNPYGWNPARVEPMRRDDTSEPGAWNPFRQGYNMTTEEARECNTTDVRLHGCSRPEYIGEYDKDRCKRGGLHATAEWIAPVAASPDSPTSPGADRDVYGMAP